MPYKNKQSPEAKESNLKKDRKYKLVHKKEINEKSRDFYSKNRKKMIQKQKDYVVRNRDRYLLLRKKRHLRKNYNISMEKYVELLESQDGVCAICGEVNESRRLLAVDHDHETDIIRGLLCDKCNRGLGFFDDDIALLFEAIKYLEKHD